MPEVTDCPHCGDRVLPQQDGRCPACSGDTRMRVDGALLSCRIHARDEGRLPPICVVCGGETTEAVVVRRSRAEAGPIPSPILFVLNPLRWFIQRELHREQLSIALPVHRGCALEEAAVLSVDHMTDCLVMRVHPAFKRAYRPEDRR